MNILLIKRI